MFKVNNKDVRVTYLLLTLDKFCTFSSVSIADLIYANAIYHGNIAQAYLELSETLMMELFLQKEINYFTTEVPVI